jgi:hypothetical protein
MSNTNEDTAHVWRSALEKKLREERRNDIVIAYAKVSPAFPGGPHSTNFDLQRIDGKALQSWAKDLGWHVQVAPEVTDPTQRDTPAIRFTRIVQG